LPLLELYLGIVPGTFLALSGHTIYNLSRPTRAYYLLFLYF
jgi:hypothetical protein